MDQQTQQTPPSQGAPTPNAGGSPEYKPNIYPIMYWALAYGVLAGVILFVVFLLSSIITVVWFPVFLAGLVWGAYRNYKKQKSEWYSSQGAQSPSKSAIDEFKDAVSDITTAGREMVAEQAAEDAEAEAIAEAEVVEEAQAEQPPTPPQQPQPPQPPTPPQTPPQ